MEKIVLIVDSASDIKQDFAKLNNITIVPFKVICSDKEYIDGVDINSDTLYELLKREVPSTSLPSVDSYASALKTAIKNGYTHAIIITISSGLSGSFNSARLAAESVPEINTFVLDSMTLTMSQGAIALEALNMINSGRPFNEIIKILPTFIDKVDVFFTMETLEYLIKGGRIGKVSGTIASVLNLKPIITVGTDGIYHTVSKIRGINQSISKLASILKPYTDEGPCKVWIMDGNAPDKAQMLYEAIKDYDNLVECNLGGCISPVLGVHTGPGLIGLIVEKLY